jgi:hypothetical protein
VSDVLILLSLRSGLKPHEPPHVNDSIVQQTNSTSSQSLRLLRAGSAQFGLASPCQWSHSIERISRFFVSYTFKRCATRVLPIVIPMTPSPGMLRP